jgi:cephalosporin hydroxylase
MGTGNSPKSAIYEYQKLIQSNGLKGQDGTLLNFENQKHIDNKLLISVTPDGYLKRT